MLLPQRLQALRHSLRIRDDLVLGDHRHRESDHGSGSELWLAIFAQRRRGK
jgi:hypothetical protein